MQLAQMTRAALHFDALVASSGSITAGAGTVTGDAARLWVDRRFAGAALIPESTRKE